MVVVPALAVGQQPDPPEIAAVVGRVVVAIAPDMRGRIDRPGDVHDPNQPQKHAVDQKRKPDLPTPAEPAGTKQHRTECEVPERGRCCPTAA